MNVIKKASTNSLKIGTVSIEITGIWTCMKIGSKALINHPDILMLPP